MTKTVIARSRVPGSSRSRWRTLCFAAICVTACGQGPSEPGDAASTAAGSGKTQAERLIVYTVNYPLFYFASRIGGDYVQVEFPAPPNGDPAAWAPEATDIIAYRQADLVLLNGAGYADWIERASLPEDRLVDTSAGFAQQYIAEDASTHSHGPGAAHSHEATTAFTTWLDPQLAIEQAVAIRDALSARQPESATEFEAGFERLRADLYALDQQLAALFSDFGDTPVVFSHPVYQYLQRRYSVNGISVHWEPDEMPDDTQTMELAKKLAAHPASIMIWEDSPLPGAAEMVATWDIASVVLNPCGNRPETGDYMDVMRQNVTNLRAVIADTGH